MARTKILIAAMVFLVILAVVVIAYMTQLHKISDPARSCASVGGTCRSVCLSDEEHYLFADWSCESEGTCCVSPEMLLGSNGS